MKRLFLIDGHSLIFKMYYAFLRRPMVNSKGEDTSILFGFTKYIIELIQREQPTHLAIAFDPPAKTFRHELFPQYKGTRSATPQPVIDALEPLLEICRALGIPVLMQPGYEADDAIGSFATKAAGDGYEVYMVTVDKDYGQLLGRNIIQYKPGKTGAERELLTAEDLCARYGIQAPSQFIDILTIWGDTADNIPGVKGIGEVGASKLVSKWGSIDNIYAHLDELTPKQREAFEEARGRIGLSRELATIKTDLEFGISEDDLRCSIRYTPQVAGLVARHELPSLKKLFPEAETAPEAEITGLECRRLAPEDFLARAKAHGIFSVSLLPDGTCAAATSDDGSDVMPADSDEAAEVIRTLMHTPGMTLRGHSLKEAVRQALRPDGDTRIEAVIQDTELMHYLLSPETAHKAGMLFLSYLGTDTAVCRAQGFGEDAQAAPEETDLFSAEPAGEGQPDYSEAVTQAILSYRLAPVLEEELRKQDLYTLYSKTEAPLVPILAAMENDGVRINPDQLLEYRGRLEKEMNTLEQEIRALAEEPSLNISSPKQLGTVLYEKLALNPKFKKTAKGGYPTDEETLNDLPVKHPIVDKILSFRGIKKLISTYIDPLRSLADPHTGKIHPTFNQALTATGRLSCSKPNLQNIPVRSEEGREIRKAFIPSDPQGYILSADYSQIELRIMAHISCDRHMTEAFNKGEDIHAMTASRIFGVPVGEVTADQRRMAKTANFGILYGISAFGLSQRLGIPRTEAKKMIDDYFTSFPGIEAYIKDCIAATTEKGYTETLFGRRRYLPDIRSANSTVRALAERNAVNAPIQGTAADIIKMAMVNIAERLRQDGFRSRMVLQIHDELVFDVVPGEEERLSEMVRREMESVAELSVSLTAQCSWAKNLLEAH